MKMNKKLIQSALTSQNAKESEDEIKIIVKEES